MSKIDQLLKNENVEWKKLGKVALISKGKQFNKRDMLDEGTYPVINGGVLPSGYIDVFNSKENSITVSQGGASAGFVNFIETKFWLGAHAFSVVPSDDTINNYNYDYNCFNRFLFHILKMNQIKLQDSKIGAGIPSVSKDELSNIEVPLTSKKTQEKIVKILDKFINHVTDLQAALQAELQARNKQYEYYRDTLLSEEYLKKLSENTKLLESNYKLRSTTLGDIGKFTRGNGLQKRDFISKGKPVIHYGQIYTKFNFEADKTISFVNDDVFSKLKKANFNDILIATTSENIEDVGKCVVWLGNEEIGFSGDMYSYSTKENSKYIAYYFQTNKFQKQKEQKVTGTKLIRIHGDDMAKFSITLPPRVIQNKVVEVLDKFQSLLSDTQGLLPEEIEQRQKQYEYYREKLLTFEDKSDSTPHAARRKITLRSYFATLKQACGIVDVSFAGVEWKKLGDVAKGKLEYGSGTKAVIYDDRVRYIRITDIDENGNLKREKVSPKNIEEKFYLKPGDLLFARSGATVGKNFLYDGEENSAIFAGYLIRLRVDEKIVIPKYVYYCVKTSIYRNFVNKTMSIASQPNINAKQYSEYRILVPPIEVQEYVVSILDKYDKLVNDINEGLPKEIELRQKQYEYYRERLLNFPK